MTGKTRYPKSELYARGLGVMNADGVEIPVITADGTLLPTGQTGIAYYVSDNDGLDTNDGLSWGSAFKTLAVAFAASHASIASGAAHWDTRNRIYISGAPFVATLVALPQKTDVIGCGSYDANDMASITGNHAPVNTAYGCRFYNVWFNGASAAAPIWTVTSATPGLKFYGCMFRTAGATKNTTAVTATAAHHVELVGCEFEGAFSANYVSIGAGEAGGLKIADCEMTGIAAAGVGLVLATGVAGAVGSLLLARNIIKVTNGLVINDVDASLLVCVDNRLISAAAVGNAAGSGIVVWNAKKAVGNLIVCNDANGPLPVLVAPA